MGESELSGRLRAEGLAAEAWSNAPGDVYAVHRHAYDKVIVCSRGSITFGLPGRGETLLLGAGDRLDLPAGTDHDAAVGPSGVTCLEAHLPAGRLGWDPAVRPAGSW
jgi:quercetin dioxygenase-like cupin family protein